MSFFSDYLAPEKDRHGRGPGLSDGAAVTFTLLSVAVIVVALIGASRLVMALFY
jgi:hypothetical protein